MLSALPETASQAEQTKKFAVPTSFQFAGLSKFFYFMNDEGRIASLDGLRALAILLVLLSHLLSNFTSHLPYLGNFGVKVFFVISGFLITAILVAEFEKTETINLKKFYFRRTLRIFPAYYF